MNRADGIPKGVHSLTDKQKIERVKTILDIISKCMFAYDEIKQTIDFDVACIGLTSKNIDDIIGVFTEFKDYKNIADMARDSKSLAILLEHCYASIECLKHVKPSGQVYYDIVSRYYINKEFKNTDEATEKICSEYTRQTFFRRCNSACLELYHIWFCKMPRQNIDILTEILSL